VRMVVTLVGDSAGVAAAMAGWLLACPRPPMPGAPPSASFSHSTSRPDSSPDFVSRLAGWGRAAAGRVLSLSHKQAVSDAHKGVPLSAAHCQAISDGMQGVSRVGNGQPVDLTKPNARQGVCHCRCGCGPCDSSRWYANGLLVVLPEAPPQREGRPHRRRWQGRPLLRAHVNVNLATDEASRGKGHGGRPRLAPNPPGEHGQGMERGMQSRFFAAAAGCGWEGTARDGGRPLRCGKHATQTAHRSCGQVMWTRAPRTPVKLLHFTVGAMVGARGGGRCCGGKRAERYRAQRWVPVVRLATDSKVARTVAS
jgi:hypothetical protein